ncbi:MAG: glycosyltransferase [Candidatus Heimdallarchaeaceae archaeon]
MGSDGTKHMISFVIPTLNEQEFIEKNLSIIKALMEDVKHEVIVVDNGSTDNTVNMVKQFDVKLLIDSSRTISGLRNLGASYAKGEILVFLDADVMITKPWVKEISNTMETICNDNNPIVTGSRYGVRENPSWIEKYWFLPMMNETANYINGGNLIIKKDLFIELGGFSERLVTAEDYEFCLRAKRKGIIIESNPGFYAIHEGYPRTIRTFIKREIWHGSQDFSSFSDFIGSKVAIVSIIYCLLPFFGIIASLLGNSLIAVFLCLCVNQGIALIATFNKRTKYRLNIYAYLLLYNVYFAARGLSVMTRLNFFRTG